MSPENLIFKYTEGNEELRHVLLQHSKDVSNMALHIIDKHRDSGLVKDVFQNIDRQFVWEAAMLHDIGIIGTDAPDIYCNGTEPYLMHGLIGGEILRSEGLDRHARVAERHTGTGLTAKCIREQRLPLPEIDLCPESIEEQLICYADKFYSKTNLGYKKPIEKICRSLNKFGNNVIDTFENWYNLFGE